MFKYVLCFCVCLFPMSPALAYTPDTSQQPQRSGWLIDTELRPQNESRQTLVAKASKSDQKYYKKLRKSLRQNWRTNRFWWSIELGNFMHFFVPFKENRPTHKAFDYNGFLIGGRWGYGGKNLIVTGDIIYAMSDDMTLQLGITVGLPLRSFFIVEAGTGLTFIFADDFESGMSLHIPIDVGFTVRIPLKNISLGLRTVGSIAFSADQGGGVMMSLRVSLVLGMM
ncbi:MAG TPA: hypothetical protein DCE42_19615 [Myxococcales bacterium]|nr:hypothetical protein [Deltaproteobacteria bacterium]MBU53020.1 hypothetical protein [Deltaproteobacteria bacterium]HAA56984.1 hypothetical protein [Myxococcales bacterium]